MKTRFARAVMNADRPVTFADFSLDLANEQLGCDGEVVLLTSKAFAVLRRLVEHRGALVTKTGLVARFDLAAVRHPAADNGFRS